MVGTGRAVHSRDKDRTAASTRTASSGVPVNRSSGTNGIKAEELAQNRQNVVSATLCTRAPCIGIMVLFKKKATGDAIPSRSPCRFRGFRAERKRNGITSEDGAGDSP